MIEGEPTEFSADLALLRDGAERWPNAQGLRLRERWDGWTREPLTTESRQPVSIRESPQRFSNALKTGLHTAAPKPTRREAAAARRGRAGSNQGRLCPVFAGMTTIDSPDSPASWTNSQLFPPVRAISPESANSSTRQHRSTIERA